ncbi:MAG: hypothetical protein KAJ19_12910 [Gammaproteobacteria bacterium]|nr:hypothetical protein [Gammaproteobacteria bacterium]
MDKTKRNKNKNKSRDYFNSKPMNLPSKFVPGFLEDLDKRSVVYQAVRKSFNQTCDDLGGADALSHARLVLIQRFVFGEFIAANLEAAIIAKPTEKLVSKWLSVSKALGALAVRIGLERQARSVPNVADYVQSKSKKKRRKL